VNPDAPKGGTFRQSSFGGFDSLNPFINKGVAAENVSAIYDTLMRQSLDEPFTEYGLVAGKIEKAPDNSWVRFYLRPEARFHDGHPMRADDVVFTFNALIKDGAPLYRQYYMIPNWYLDNHRLAYRNRFGFVTTPPYTLGLNTWWLKTSEKAQ